MSIWGEGTFYTAEQFLSGEMDDFLKSSTFSLKGRKHVVEYNNLIITGDTETSHTMIDGTEIGWVYQWAICICETVDKPYFIYGRKPSEMVDCFLHISEILDLSSDRKALVFFHNFSYDFEYLKAYIYNSLDSSEGEDRGILATGAHKIISYTTTSGIEFRCTYRLSNASLAFWSKEILHTRHKKLVGAVDYDIVRYQNSKLNRQDWRYMFYDVLVDAECVIKTMEQDNDTTATLPLTSTGYVRRETRRSFNRDKRARWEFKGARLNERSYLRLRSAQAGGYTHASRFYAGKTVDIKDFKDHDMIQHFDMRSFYPSMQRVKRFPVSKLVLTHELPSDDAIQLCKLDKSKCHLYHVLFKDITINKEIAFPYISASKARAGKVSETLNITEDNGRVLEIEGAFILTLTDEDLEIIEKQYIIPKDNIKILEIWSAKADYLPEWIVRVIDNFYKGKSDWKIKTKLDKHDEIAASMLMKVKALLNGIYGMTATNPIHDSYYELNGEWLTQTADIQEALDKYYENFSSFNWLQWGVWTTSYSRYELMLEAERIGWKNILYADTDSLFFLSSPEIREGIEYRNKVRYDNAIQLKAFIKDSNDKIVTYDAFEDEGENIIQFRTLHSKCYAYNHVYKDKDTGEEKTEFLCTIAGVPRKGHGVTREQELGNIDNLNHGFVFHKCGGTTIKYFEHEIADEYINGHHIEYSSSAIITHVDKKIKFEELDFDVNERWTDLS